MGSRTMAVKLILVTLLVCTLSLCLAQQSDRTGGSDRRLSLRRFSNRKKVENTRSTGRVKASADILERRKQLFQRNPSRRRNFGAESRSRSEENVRVRTTTERVRTTTEAFVEVEPPVENISNNDQEIIDLVLDKQDQEEGSGIPFKGVSEVRTISSPSGFRSSNEQIVRISFKKTTEKPVVENETNVISQKEIRTTAIPRRNLAGRRRLGIRRKGQQSGSSNVRVSTTEDRKFKNSEASNPLKNLLKIASDDKAEEKTLEPVDIEAAIKEMKEDNMIEKTSDIEAAIHEMKEDNGRARPRSRSRGNSPRRLAGSARVNVRGRNGQRQPTQGVTPRKESKPNFRSFPARQNTNTGRVSQPKPSRSRPTPRQRFETRPTVSPTQADLAPTPTESFQGFDFSTPTIQQHTVTEAPRSTFQLNQNFQGINQNVIEDQQIISAAAKPVQPPPQVNQFPQPSAPIQPQVTSLSPQAPAPAITQQFQTGPPQQVLPQNSFNLLNAKNFQAFDAQFGGSVPTNPGASQLASSIFAQPQTALLQGRDVLVNPQNGFQTTPVQAGQVFQQPGQVPQQRFQEAGRVVPQAAPQAAPQAVFTQATPQFSSGGNIPSVSFSGHPASDINLQTGSFNLRTG